MSELKKKIFRYIDEHTDEHVKRFQESIKVRSLSMIGEGVMDGAKHMIKLYDQLGCRETGIAGPWGEPMGQGGAEGNPVAYGEYNVGAEKTLAFYMMYDTMPVFEAESEWLAPPFEGRLVEWPPYPKVLIGRGATNSKGPQMVGLNALYSIEAVAGKLPVNVKFVAEGDEERTSRGLWPFVKEKGEWLRSADSLFFPIGGTDRKGKAVPICGTEGYLYINLVSSGEYWGRGPTKYGVHGSNKLVLDSPAWRLIDALSTLTSSNGNKIKVKGWHDRLEKPSKEDLALVNKIVRMGYGDPKELKEELGARVFIDNIEDPKQLLMRRFFGTSFNLDGVYGGRMTPGGGAVVPVKLTSKHNIRLRPKQSPDDILKKIRRHLDSHGYKDIKIEVEGKREPVKNNWNTEIAKAAIRAYEEFNVPYVLTPPTVSLGETSPAWPANIFVRELGLDVMGAGIGHGERAHTINEMYVIEGAKKIHGFADAEKFIVSCILEYAGIS